MTIWDKFLAYLVSLLYILLEDWSPHHKHEEQVLDFLHEDDVLHLVRKGELGQGLGTETR